MHEMHDDHHEGETEDHDHLDIDIRNKTLHIEKGNEFYLNDLHFMPVYEIRSLVQSQDAFDIFLDEEVNSENQEYTAWDSLQGIDYKKLQKYIQFQVNVIKTEDGKTSNVITEFKNCAKEDFEHNGYK